MMEHSTKKPHLAALTLGSIGVVYGDIGTSPLYAFRESLAATSKLGAIDEASVLGLLSLIVWTLLIIVTLKYVMLLLRADNKGEGGILSLMALARHAVPRYTSIICYLGMAGAALFYGDAVITPAISILSAVEGIKLITHHFEPYILPLAIGIITTLCLFQAHGTAKVARFFAPIMLVWFVVLALGGLHHINDHPIVWQALNPYYAVYFMTHHGATGLIALGAVFLTVTGAEALYADMGHFGRKPIRLAWLLLVMPALVLNYFGQAALVLAQPDAVHNSFFLLYPDWALPAVVILSTFATVIASQAVITGAYSLSYQAIQLGLLPRLRVDYTSEQHSGQIYMPLINGMILIGVVMLILLFRNSSNLASAYGIAVTGTMLITSVLALLVMRHVWRWSLLASLAIMLPLFAIELVFFTGNMLKLFDGGYVPIIISAVMIMLMITWMRGSAIVYKQAHDHTPPMEELIRELKTMQPKRIEGTAVFLSSDWSVAPSALIQNLKHNKVLHTRNLLVTLRFADTPYANDASRIEIEPIDETFTRIFMTFGFMEQPNVVQGLRLLRDDGFKTKLMNTSFFISRRKIVASAHFGMPLWQDRIFIALANNASDAAAHYHIPLSRVVELGVPFHV